MTKAQAQAAAAALKTSAETAFHAASNAALATFETAFASYLAAKTAADAMPDDPTTPPTYIQVFNNTGFPLSVAGMDPGSSPEGQPFTIDDQVFFALELGHGFNGMVTDSGNNLWSIELFPTEPTTLTIGSNFPNLDHARTSFVLEGDYFSALASSDGYCTLNTFNGMTKNITCANYDELVAAVAAAINDDHVVVENVVNTKLRVSNLLSNQPIVLNITKISESLTTDDVTLIPV
jgi:hypothetical protein